MKTMYTGHPYQLSGGPTNVEAIVYVHHLIRVYIHMQPRLFCFLLFFSVPVNNIHTLFINKLFVIFTHSNKLFINHVHVKELVSSRGHSNTFLSKSLGVFFSFQSEITSMRIQIVLLLQKGNRTE